MLLRWLKSELITQPARQLSGWIGSERTSAVQGALPAGCWEIFPMFGKPTIGKNQQRWGSVALGFEPLLRILSMHKSPVDNHQTDGDQPQNYLSPGIHCRRAHKVGHSLLRFR
jgi:hypothetical protein